ncbi:MAG TPA: biotin/lipoyl-binding protein, partial [Casimicrobiaceae bacterium]|nr:biotin/lipoyl-binding protein [Casimicrobiaceae bacterium]
MIPPHFRALVLALAALALAGCGDAGPPQRQGYVEGEFVNVASPIAGRLDRLSVRRGDAVSAGAPLFALEAESEAAARRQAAEQVRAAEASLADLHSGKRPQELDVTRAQLAQARIEERKSATRLARDEAQAAI